MTKTPFAKLSRFEKLGNAFYKDQSTYKGEVKEIFRREKWGSPQKLLGPYERGATSPLGGAISYPKGQFTIRRTR